MKPSTRTAKTLARAISVRSLSNSEELICARYELLHARRDIERLERELAEAKELAEDLQFRAAKAYGAMEMAEKLTGVVR